jgi:homogentisate 1,2-dioxygenase
VKHWISLPRSEGRASRQAHADLPEGSYEREIGRDGFYGPATHMYHAHPPTGWSRFEGPLRPRALDTERLKARSRSPWDATPLLISPHVRYRFWRSEGSMPDLVRNADGDELLFLHEGTVELFCDYGHLSLRDGDYLVLPRGTMWRLQSDAPFAVLLIEASDGSYRLPDRGPLGAHAFFDPAALETPHLDDAFRAQQDERTWRVVVQARGQLSTISFPFNPLDAVGWKGDLAPVRINWRDLRPIVSARYHLPPSVHTTFASEHFVVCTFCPRPLETDPGALKLPFFHSNDDYDEVIFYHRGSFMSRDDIHPGSISFHPRGFAHGPHPKALQASRDNPRRETDEVAVMIDTRSPLDLTPEALAIEDPAYVCSWGASG